MPYISMRRAIIVLAVCLGITSVQSTDIDLKVDKKVVAKLQGNFSWLVSFNVTDRNKTVLETQSFNLEPYQIQVNGSQTDSLTSIVVKPVNSTEKYHIINTSFDFAKENSVVYMVKAALTFSAKGHQYVVDWTEKVPLASNSSFSYACSELKMNNHGNIFSINEAVLQPFDLNDQQFGEKEICSRDQTTTVAPATTTVSPKPAPATWVVTADAYSCIRMTANISLFISYLDNNGNDSTVTVFVPSSAAVTTNSTCNFDATTSKVGSTQILQLMFPMHGNPWFLTFNFTNDTKITHDDVEHPGIEVYATSLDYVQDGKTFVNASKVGERKSIGNNLNNTLAMFKTDSLHHYRCNSEEKTVVLNGSLTVVTHDLRVEAFLSNSTQFLSAERVCVADQQAESSDLVPIITGAALAALVLFVLIAYLVGRARAKASTYETI